MERRTEWWTSILHQFEFFGGGDDNFDTSSSAYEGVKFLNTSESIVKTTVAAERGAETDFMLWSTILVSIKVRRSRELQCPTEASMVPVMALSSIRCSYPTVSNRSANELYDNHDGRYLFRNNDIPYP